MLTLGQGIGMQLGGRPVGPVELTYGDGASFMRFRRAKPKASPFLHPLPAEGNQLP